MGRTASRLRGAAVAALAMIAWAPPAPAQVLLEPSAPGAIEPGALEALARMRAALQAMRSFEVRLDVTAEEALADMKVQTTARVRYDYRAPDRLFGEWASDRILRRLYFDGKTATIDAPALGYFAQVAAPGTVAQLMRTLAVDYGLVFPLPDLFEWAATNPPLTYTINAATYLGPADIAGTPCDHYAVQGAAADWQIWIAREGPALPRKVAIADKGDPRQPVFTALIQWNPDPALSDGHFAFNPTPAQRKVPAQKRPANRAGQ